MTEEAVASGPQETKRVNIAGLTEGLRRKELERITGKLARDGWTMKEYNEAGMSGSHAIFTRPFTPGAKPKQAPKAVQAVVGLLVAVAAFAIFGGGDDDKPGQAGAPSQVNMAEVMAGDLKAYKKLDKAARAGAVGTYLAENAIPADQQQNFYNFLSEAVVQKSDSLAVKEVLGWAKAEYEKTAGKWSRPHYNLDDFELQFSAWDGSHRNLERLIKKSMNDEDSYEHVETRYRLVLEGKGAPHVVLITTFSGKNAFGARIKKTVTATATLDGTILDVGDF